MEAFWQSKDLMEHLLPLLDSPSTLALGSKYNLGSSPAKAHLEKPDPGQAKILALWEQRRYEGDGETGRHGDHPVQSLNLRLAGPAP